MNVAFVLTSFMLLVAATSGKPPGHEKIIGSCVAKAYQNEACARECGNDCAAIMSVIRCVKQSRGGRKEQQACAQKLCPESAREMKACIHGRLCLCATCMKSTTCPKIGDMCQSAFETIHPCN